MYQANQYPIQNTQEVNNYIMPEPAYEYPAYPMNGCAPAVPGVPETLTNPIYTPAILSQYIGKLMRVEFLIGSCTTERTGRLLSVGASYILLQSVENGVTMLCDLASIRFATIMNNEVVSMGGGLYL